MGKGVGAAYAIVGGDLLCDAMERVQRVFHARQAVQATSRIHPTWRMTQPVEEDLVRGQRSWRLLCIVLLLGMVGGVSVAPALHADAAARAAAPAISYPGPSRGVPSTQAP